jgi:hypothetical protein
MTAPIVPDVGFTQSIMFAANAEFSNTGNPLNELGLINDLDIWVGSTTPNAGGTNVNVLTMTAGTNMSIIANMGDGTVTFNNTNAGSFSSINVQTITSSSTYTPTAGRLFCKVEQVGGGGGGGGSTNTSSSSVSMGAGGGGGEYAVGYFSAATIGASKAIVIGAGGAGGAAGGANNGSAGGTTTFGGTLLTAVGGSGGTGGIAATGGYNFLGGNGGTGGTGGYMHVAGMPGADAYVVFGFMSQAGGGGSSYFGGMGNNITAIGGSSFPGVNGLGFGAGGGGGFAFQSSGSGEAGGTGSSGVVVITEYI